MDRCAGYSNGGSIRALQFGQNSDEIYIASSWSFAYPVGIFKTTDRGINWNNIGQGFEGYASVNDVKVYLNSLEHIYIGLDAGEDTTGMYVKKNDQQWEHYGLTDISISSIAIENNLMYAATDSGMYVRDFLSGVDPETNNYYEIDYLIYPAYPNPFNSTTNIKYSIPHSGRITLKVFDLMGNKIATLLDRYQAAGSYDIIFQADDLASGIYFYQLKTKDYVDVKKMILIK